MKNSSEKVLSPNRHMTSFQRLLDVYTTSATSYRRLIDAETTSCVYWHISALEIHLGSRQLRRVLPRQTVLAKYVNSLQFSILISRQNFRLQTKEITCMCLRSVCTCYKKSDRQFIHPPCLYF